MSAADLVDDRYSTMVPPRRWGAAVDGQRLAGLVLATSENVRRRRRRRRRGRERWGWTGAAGIVGRVCLQTGLHAQGLSSLVGLS